MQFTSTMTGLPSPSPLQFAFSSKSSAHASRRGGRPMQPEHQQWLAWWQQPSQASARALYLHIPFCTKRCSFCNFFENGANPGRIERYVTALCEELERAADTPLAQSRPFEAVYLGGGTPTDMTAEQLARVLAAVRRFPLAADAEVTLEGRLHGFDDEKWQAALAGGVNRLSFGVQSFDSKVRLAAGRIDDRDTVMSRLQTLGRRNQAVVVADLIFGLPWQSHEVWQQDLSDLLECDIHGVDLYQLIALPGNNLERFQASGRQPDGLPSHERALMYAAGADRLERAGWQRLSCSHWRRSEDERSLYNQLAKGGAEILPFGAGAGGKVHQFALMNGRDLAGWHAALEKQERVPGMVIVSAPHAAKEGAVRHAMDCGVLPYSLLPSDQRALLMALFAIWQQHGLAECGQDALTLTLAGRFWTVNLQAGLFECLDAHREAPVGHPGREGLAHPGVGR